MSSATVAGGPDSAVRGVWLFDVDGTLIGSLRSDVLRPRVAELFDLLRRDRRTIVIWSAGGADYAKRKLTQFGLTDYVAGFYAKDRRGEDGRYLVSHLPPHHRPGTCVDDFPQDMPLDSRIVAVPQFFGGNPADNGLEEAINQAIADAAGSD